jgi:hypothetical protein
MAKSTDRGGRSWDLALIVLLVMILSVATDIAGFLRFAPGFGIPDWAAVVCVVPTKLIEWRFLTFAARLWRRNWLGMVQAPIFVFIWGLAVALSALAAQATIVSALTAADHGAVARAELRTNLATALARVNGQLEAFAKPLPRPVQTVQQALSWATSVASVTGNCVWSRREARREDCKEVIALRKELAAATDYARLAQEQDRLRDRLAGLSIEAIADPMPVAFEASIGRLFGLDGKNGIALMGMLMLALVSAFGPFGLDTLRDASPAWSARPEPAHPARVSPARNPPPAGARPRSVLSALGGARACPPGQAEGAHAGEPAQDSAGQTRSFAQGRPRSATLQSRPQPTRLRVDPAAAAKAIEAFVDQLEHEPMARATGSELASAYNRARGGYDWPDLPANVIGFLLKAAVEARGGRKLKSSVQMYEGVRVPVNWRNV